MTSEERIDELEKKVRIMEMANDNLSKRLDNMSEQLKIVNDSIGKIYDILSIQDVINHINMMTK
ncbi:hypothetical protein [uncultured Eubacterium sp.]|uniref:hypothetical protein n=1 Tax=uncultured Eubacterium sp. TaxID=165185 RepID=UPI0025E1A1FF|nr:hypothetical protein [uncultured Eubacterium sp.]